MAGLSQKKIKIRQKELLQKIKMQSIVKVAKEK